MAWLTAKNRLLEFTKKNIYVVLILFAGILFLLLPTSDKSDTQTEEIKITEHDVSLEEQLAKILSKIKGAGEVSIVLTTQVGEEIIYQVDETFSGSSENSSNKVSTVVIEDKDGNEIGLVRQVRAPTYLGAIVVCQGADSPSVRLAITEAVSKATGLGADKISVLKMK